MNALQAPEAPRLRSTKSRHRKVMRDLVRPGWSHEMRPSSHPSPRGRTKSGRRQKQEQNKGGREEREENNILPSRSPIGNLWIRSRQSDVMSSSSFLSIHATYNRYIKYESHKIMYVRSKYLRPRHSATPSLSASDYKPGLSAYPGSAHASYKLHIHIHQHVLPCN